MPGDVLSVLGARIKAARKERGLSQGRLAEQTALSTRHISNVEKGDTNLSFEVLSALIKALGVSVDAILNPSSDPVDAEIQEIANLYRACPEQGRQRLLVVVRAMAGEMADKPGISNAAAARSPRRPAAAAKNASE